MSTADRSEKPWRLGLLLAFLGGVLAWMLLDRILLNSTRSPSPAAPVGAPGSAALLEAIQRLGEDVRLLAERLERSTSGVSPVSRTPVVEGLDPGLVTDLRSAIAELTRAVQMTPRSNTAPGASRGKGRQPLPVEDGNQDPSVAMKEINDRYRLWSYQDVLDAFGVPDGTHLQDNQSLTWSYNADPQGERGVSFKFFDGMVIGVSRWGQ